MVKLEGSTIIETIVAVLIISVCFEIALVSISKAYISENSKEIINATYLAEQEINFIEKERDFTDRNIKIEGYNLTRSISPYQRINNLFLLVVNVEKDGKLILQKKKLILNNVQN